jgi:hypothetical protein
MEKKTSWKNLANYDYLGAYSLQGVAEEVTLTIKLVKKERVTANGGASEDCIVAYFEETNKDNVVVKPMVLNKTNCKIIEKLYNTPFIEEWVGKQITIYATTTKFARDIVPCLRIRNELPKVVTYNCSVCGKEISKAMYDGSIAKYGKAYCSKECLEKDNNTKEGE